MENQKFSLKEALEMTIRDIMAINVPMAYAIQISMPLSKCLNNLQMCVEAINIAEKAKEEKKDA